MNNNNFSIFLEKKTFKIKYFQHIITVLMLFGLLVFTSCNSTEPEDPNGNNGGTLTTNTVAAKVNGTPIQTSFVTSLITNSGVTELAIVGIFSNASPQSSITINVENPAVGTFAIKDGQYSNTDESKYYVVNENEGSGSIKINEYSTNKVTGTFEFTAIGIDAASGNPNGEQVQVTEGSFNVIPISN